MDAIPEDLEEDLWEIASNGMAGFFRELYDDLISHRLSAEEVVDILRESGYDYHEWLP